MPEDYDFSTKKKNWSQYHNDFILRTDAVWEKGKLLDWFRCYFKNFYYNPEKKMYMVAPPLDMSEALWDPFTIGEKMVKFDGFTLSGRTNSFQRSKGPYEEYMSSNQTNFQRQDYFELCAFKFDKWFECDAYHDGTQKNYAAKNQDYPCYKHFYEAQYACSDQLFDYLL